MDKKKDLPWNGIALWVSLIMGAVVMAGIETAPFGWWVVIVGSLAALIVSVTPLRNWQLPGTKAKPKLPLQHLAALRSVGDTLGEEEQRWREEIDHFKLVALDFWRLLIASFSRSDIHGSAIDWDSLSPTVRTACWPSEEPSDRNVAMATAQVRELTRRIYSLDGKTLFSVDESSELEAIRHPMNETIKKWGAVLSGSDCDRLTALLRDNLVPHDRETIKLLQYVEESNAASTKHHNPDHRHFDMVRAALMPQEPDTEVPSSARVTSDKEWRAERKEFEKKYRKYRDLKTEIFNTLEILIKGNRRGDLWAVWINMNAEDYWPSDQFYLEAFDLISNGETRFESQTNFNAFKKRLRRVQGFLQYVQSLPEEFPEAEHFLVERNVASHQYSFVHVLWYLWHALGDVTHGYQKREKFTPLPGWHRLWAEWNRSSDVPEDPKLLLDPESLNTIEAVVPKRPGYSTPSTPDAIKRTGIRMTGGSKGKITRAKIRGQDISIDIDGSKTDIEDPDIE